MNAQKFRPVFTVDQHGTIAFILLFSAFLLTGLFSMSSSITTLLILDQRIKVHLLGLWQRCSLPSQQVSFSGIIFDDGG